MKHPLRLTSSSPLFERYGFLLVLILIGVAGLLLRIMHYPNIPPGFNVDEASSMYEAYCLAETGMDRWGNVLPPYFPSWGSGQNVLLSYLAVPIVKIFGLTVFSARLISLSLGILTLPLIAIALRPLGRFPAALGMFLVAIVPWHFMMSRWALESNLAPFFMLLGCVMLSRALITNKRRWILPGLLPFALALYAYGTTVLVLPPMMLLLICVYWPRIRSRGRAWILAALGFVVAAFPFGVFFLENQVLGRNLAWTDSLPFATPMLPSNRLDQINTQDWETILKANQAFFNSGFQDGTSYNLLPGFPLLLLFTFPLALVGIIVAIIRLLRRAQNAGPAPVVVNVFLFWALSAMPMLAIFTQNVNRFNHFYLPAIVLAVWAIDRIISHFNDHVSKRLARSIVVVWLIIEGVLCTQNYFTYYEYSSIRSAFNAGLEEAFAEAEKLPVGQIKITDQMPLPYVYTLFFTQYPPRKFQQETNPRLSDGAYQVARFGKYIFNDDSLDAQQPFGYLARKGQYSGDAPARRVIFSDEMWEVGIIAPKILETGK